MQLLQNLTVRNLHAELDNVKEQMQRMQEEHKSNCQRHADMLTKVMSLIQANGSKGATGPRRRMEQDGN